MNIPAIVVGVLLIVLVALVLYALMNKASTVESSKTILNNTIKAITSTKIVENYESAVDQKIKASNFAIVDKTIAPVISKYTTEKERTACGALSEDEIKLKNTVISIMTSFINMGEITSEDKYNDFCSLFLAFIYMMMLIKGEPPAYSIITSPSGSIESVKVTKLDFFIDMVRVYMTTKTQPPYIVPYYNRSIDGVCKILVDYNIVSASDAEIIKQNPGSVNMNPIATKIREHKQYTIPYSLFCDMIVVSQHPQIFMAAKQGARDFTSLCSARF